MFLSVYEYIVIASLDIKKILVIMHQIIYINNAEGFALLLDTRHSLLYILFKE